MGEKLAVRWSRNSVKSGYGNDDRKDSEVTLRYIGMHLTYDPKFNVAYLRFRQKSAKLTTVVVSDELNVDLLPDDKVYGIELLNANEQLGMRRLRQMVVEDLWAGKEGIADAHNTNG